MHYRRGSEEAALRAGICRPGCAPVSSFALAALSRRKAASVTECGKEGPPCGVRTYWRKKSERCRPGCTPVSTSALAALSRRKAASVAECGKEGPPCGIPLSV